SIAGRVCIGGGGQLSELRKVRVLDCVELELSGRTRRRLRAGDDDLTHDIHIGDRGLSTGRGGRHLRISVPGAGYRSVLPDAVDLRTVAAPRQVRRGAEDISLLVGVIRAQRAALIDTDANTRL